MLYKNGSDWLTSKTKKILFFGMSGLGKTYTSNLLRETGDWFHYSVDYRIGTHYMNEHIVDNFKYHAMRDPFLAELLRSDSIYIASNITFENLSALSTYLGKPGNKALGGLEITEYQRRQALHTAAEEAALIDSIDFIEKSQKLYGYDNFVCDSSGSICEVVDPFNLSDPVLGSLSQKLLLIWIEGSENHTKELIRRFDQNPKPMYYEPLFLLNCWKKYRKLHQVSANMVDPDQFMRWIYAQALKHRQPRYAKMAQLWGIKIAAADLEKSKTSNELEYLIAKALDKKSN
jgi:hypothetical protein